MKRHSTKTLVGIILTIGVLGSLPAHAGQSGRGKPKPGDELINPAWVVTNVNNIELLSSNGQESQKLVGGGKADRRGPVWSPQGNWISYLRKDRAGWHIHVMCANGADDRAVRSFKSGDPDVPLYWHGLQWVPGEEDRIMYVGGDNRTYILSTIAGTPEPILLDDGDDPLLARNPALGPDIDPDTSGYQGGIAYVATNPDDPDPDRKDDIHVALVEETTTGWRVDTASTALLVIPGPQAVPTWSSDGSQLAFLGQGGPEWGTLLRTVPVLVDFHGVLIFDDFLLTLDENNKGFDGRPTWSPKDSWIAYVGQVGAAPGGGPQLDIFVVPSDDSGAPIQVTDNESAINSNRFLSPHWNPLWTNELDEP